MNAESQPKLASEETPTRKSESDSTFSSDVLADDIALTESRCAMCDHPISAAESVRIGIGPECRKGTTDTPDGAR